MNRTKDYYSILGVNQNSSKEEIKAAYRKLAFNYHPDRNKSTEASEKFKEIQEAYEVLSDEQKKYNYDNIGSSNHESIHDFIFSNFFNSNNDDSINVQLSLTLEEIAQGTEKIISFIRKNLCECYKKLDTCKKCKGQGKLRYNFFSIVQCDLCQGTGKKRDNNCKKCSGNLFIQEKIEAKINIHNGLNSSYMRYPEAGHERLKGRGDVIVNFSISEHNLYKREGEHLILEKDLKFTELLTGTKITVKSIYNKELEIKIPEITKPGTVLRIPNEGIPVSDFLGKRKGDLYVKINVIMPEYISEKNKEKIKEIEELLYS